MILTGAGEIAFCLGMDLEEAARTGAGYGLIPGRYFAGITERQRTKILIVAINGIAVAGGFGIALAADIVIAVEHARFGLIEVKRGLFAFAGGIQRLARQIPRSTAMSMILTGAPLSATRLYKLRVVSEIVPAGQLRARALELAQEIVANSGEAIRNAKLFYDMTFEMPFPQSLRLGNAFGQATLTSADSREGIAALADSRLAT